MGASIPPTCRLPNSLVKDFIKIGAVFLFSLAIAQAQSFTEKTKLTPIGPQAWHRQIYRPSGPWAVHVVEFDLRHPLLFVETSNANDHLPGYERTSSMAARRDRQRHRVVAAINGDFFGNGGIPVNLQLINGEIVREPSSRSIFALSATEKPMIDIVSLVGSLKPKNGVWQMLHGFNRHRHANDLIFYNYYFGDSTRTNHFGSEARLYPLQKFVVNDTIRAAVRELRRNTGNASLDDSTYIISGHGAANQWLTQNLAAGDTVKFIWRMLATPWQIVEGIGGLPRLIRDGKISVESEREGGSNDFTYKRHPRTAIGFNADTSRFFFVTVDGRQSGYSDGMTLPELANFMRELGCTQALNLDGGGSTTMVVRGKVVNRPSDAAGERPVANALLLISTAPTGALAHLKMQPQSITLRPGEQFDFNIIATDSIYNPLDLTDEDVFWKASPRLGNIDSRGLFTATPKALVGAKADSGYVIVYRSQARDSAWVVVK